MRFVSLALFIGLVATLSQGLANFVLKNALKQFNKQYPGLASMSRSTRSSLTHAGYDGLSPKIKNMVQKYKMRANRPLPVWKTVNTINITGIKWHNINYWYLNSIMHSGETGDNKAVFRILHLKFIQCKKWSWSYWSNIWMIEQLQNVFFH